MAVAELPVIALMFGTTHFVYADIAFCVLPIKAESASAAVRIELGDMDVAVFAAV